MFSLSSPSAILFVVLDNDCYYQTVLVMLFCKTVLNVV